MHKKKWKKLAFKVKKKFKEKLKITRRGNTEISAAQTATEFR